MEHAWRKALILMICCPFSVNSIRNKCGTCELLNRETPAHIRCPTLEHCGQCKIGFKADILSDGKMTDTCFAVHEQSSTPKLENSKGSSENLQIRAILILTSTLFAGFCVCASILLIIFLRKYRRKRRLTAATDEESIVSKSLVDSSEIQGPESMDVSKGQPVVWEKRSRHALNGPIEEIVNLVGPITNRRPIGVVVDIHGRNDDRRAFTNSACRTLQSTLV
ncbi:unnamed protein product, partial [Notodromas monacha]